MPLNPNKNSCIFTKDLSSMQAKQLHPNLSSLDELDLTPLEPRILWWFNKIPCLCKLFIWIIFDTRPQIFVQLSQNHVLCTIWATFGATTFFKSHFIRISINQKSIESICIKEKSESGRNVKITTRKPKSLISLIRYAKEKKSTSQSNYIYLKIKKFKRG